MASRIIKIQICDRCGVEERAEVVAELPPGWGKLVRQGGESRELCPACVQFVMELKDAVA